MVVTVFIKRPTAAALKPHVALKCKQHDHEKAGTATSCCGADNYLLERYVIYHVISKTNAHLMQSMQVPNNLSTEDAESVRKKKAQRDRVSDNNMVIRIYIERLLEPILWRKFW